ncbi:hypothetical protein KBI23_23685 [bacterium]|nr:hypothetical protein [bacterium]MBP9809466.1 hypothetical protein [bacterium]
MFSFKLIRAGLVLLLLTVCWHAAVTVSAQGLVGAPVDPRYGQGSEIGGLAAPGYDGVRDMVRIATGVSVLLACLFGWYRSRKVSGKRLVKELVLLVLVPLAIYFGGVYSIRNVGALGPCQVASLLRAGLSCSGCFFSF